MKYSVILSVMGASALSAVCAVEPLSESDALSQELQQQVETIAEAGIKRWEATGLTEAQLATLKGLRYEVRDLESGVLGAYCDGGIALDIDGAGQGWFVDASPMVDEEFTSVGSATRMAAAKGISDRVDLLSVVMQEQGHALGLRDSFDDAESVMFAFNAEGVRLLPAEAQAEGVVPGSLRGTHYSHYRGGSVTHTVSSSGLVTVEVFSVWRSTSISRPSFSLYTGASRSGSFLGSFTETVYQDPYASGVELGGEGFVVTRWVATMQLPNAGTFYATWNSGNRVSGINNSTAGSWELETCIVWDGSTASASPTQREATIDIVAQNYDYVQNLNSSDPDGTPVSYSFLVGSSGPNYGPISQIPGINIDGIGNVNISAANTGSLALGRWIYKTRVTDGQGAYSDRDVMVIVEDSSSAAGLNPNAPVLAAIPNQTVAVGTPLTFGVSASDADNDQVTVRAQSLPAGSSFPETTGTGSVSSTFSWTPSPGQEGVYIINVEAFDNVSVPIIDSQQVQITVTGDNEPPVLDSIGNQTVANGNTLTFVISGSDPDLDELTYSAFFLPPGATFTPATRTFSWTPTAGQFDNAFTNVRFRVTDDGVPNLFTEEAINITVGAGNEAPVITPVATVNAPINQPLTIPIVVTDALGQTISVTAPILPTGGNFSSTPGTSPVSGTFTWTPTVAGPATLRIRAEDNGVPILSSILDININVISNLPPVITLNGASSIDLECGVDTWVDPGATVLDSEDGGLIPIIVGGDTVDESTIGVYTITYDAVDSDLAAALQVTRTVNVVDTLKPVINCAQDIVVSVPTGGMSAPITYAVTAEDACDPSVDLLFTIPSSSTFPVGVHPVTATAIDDTGNIETATFNVVVLEIAVTPNGRFVDAVSVRGDTPTDSPGEIIDVNRAFLNNSGEVLFSASLSGDGSGNEGVFSGPAAGPYTAIAIKGTASGVGDFGSFDHLTLNDAGQSGFESANAHFIDGVASAAKGEIATASGGGEEYRSLQKPALASNGELLSRANLVIGSGAGVTAGDDTVITSSAGTMIAREGDATSIGGGILYSGLSNRVVTSEDNARYAFTAFLKPSSSLVNTGLFSDVLGGGDPALIVREGDAADGTPGVFANFLGESVNSAGAVAFRSYARDGGVTSDDNEGIWTNSGNTSAPPVLVAREGNTVPCLPAPLEGLVAFDRFTTLAICDDGSVNFFAYLKNATAATVVNSTNDGSIWRWTNGELHLIAREGDLANNTDGATIGRLTTFACSGTGGVVYQVEYTKNQGDYTAKNRDGIYLDRGTVDAAPELVIRRGDTFEFNGTSQTVSALEISTEENTGGGTGGYGRAINDDGDILLNLSLTGNLSGIFVLTPVIEPAPGS